MIFCEDQIKGQVGFFYFVEDLGIAFGLTLMARERPLKTIYLQITYFATLILKQDKWSAQNKNMGRHEL